MRVASGGYGAASARCFSQASLERLEKHDLFDFQIAHRGVSTRVSELQELLQRGRDERDLPDLLDEFVHELEDLIFDAGENVTFLLASLQHFRQQMELFLELDQEAQMTTSVATKNIFAAPKSSSDSVHRKSTTTTTTAATSPARRKSTTTASKSPTLRRSPGRVKQPPSPKPQQRVKAQPMAEPPPQLHNQNQTTGGGDDDIVCGVCLHPDSPAHDPIVICDLCGVAVHQSCYRIEEELPDGDWFCRPCNRYLEAKDVGSNVTPTFEIQCEACKEKGGAFIATTDDTWVHMACSMFLPELFVQVSHKHNGEEVIGGIDQLGERRKLRCCFCKKKDRGACAQCVVGKCTTSYHVLCALKHHIKFLFMEDKDHFGSGCARHQKQFCGEEHHSLPGTTTDEEAPPKPKAVKAREPSAAPPLTSSPRARVGAKGKKTLPRRRDSITSESSEGDDGIVLDEESDNSSMFSSDVDSDTNTSTKRKSPARPTSAAPVAAAAKPAAAASPAKTKRRGRPPKKQQTLLVPRFGIVKHLEKPSVAEPPMPVATAVQAPQPHATSAGPTASPLLPVSIASARPSAPSQLPAAMYTKTQLFVPITDSVLKSGFFEDVLIIISTMPLGISVRTEERANGKLMLLQGLETHNNLIVRDALRRGVLEAGDEMIAVNDVALRKREVSSLRPILTALQPPYRIHIKLKTKRNLASFGMAASMAVSAAASPLVVPIKPVIPAKTEAASPPEPKVPSLSDPVEELKPPKALEKSTDRTPMEEALSVDWPWFYLRSDGKLAMNLMWKSLEAGFFVQKFDRATWREHVGKVEALVGFCLRPTDPEYSRTTHDLLHVPSREHPVPKYIHEFRESQQQKKRYLASDSVFMGANLEQVSQDEDVWDDKPPLAVGTTVQVAKRTWPGINKLGGAGRVRKVHEQTSDDGTKKRYLYDISYVLGGSEKKVERRWIQAVVDLQGESQDTSSTKQQAEGSTDKAQDGPVAAGESANIQLRFGLHLEVTDKDAELPLITARSAERKVPFQVSVLQNSITMQSGLEANGDATKREMLWHVHFPVKQSGEDALLSDALTGSIEYVVDRGDDDESDVEDEDSEVTKQLLIAQAQFKHVMDRNETLFSALQVAVEEEYSTKQYRKRKLDEIQSKHYNQMYRDIVAARKAFDESDESSDDDEHGAGQVTTRDKSKPKERTRHDSSDSESDQDDSCGGMFINKIKQEGNEVCVLCELTGGDFAATACGRVVHPQCAMYTPETFFKNGVAHGLDQIPTDERRALTCQICSGKKGLSKIQCAHPRCTTAYHVSCAYVNGLLTRDPHYQAWCPKHLKTSGMQSEIEWPPHMKPRREATARKDHSTPAKSPQRGAKAGGAISSSKSSSKRKRRRSGTEDEGGDETRGRKKPHTIVIDGADEDGDAALADKNLARRLAIDDDSDDFGDLSVVFKKGDVVQVRAREGPNVNKPGGVARITQVNTGKPMVTYDVAYVLNSAREKQVEAKFVRAYSVEEAGDSAANGDQHKKKRSRGGASAVV